MCNNSDLMQPRGMKSLCGMELRVPSKSGLPLHPRGVVYKAGEDGHSTVPPRCIVTLDKTLIHFGESPTSHSILLDLAGRHGQLVRGELQCRQQQHHHIPNPPSIQRNHTILANRTPRNRRTSLNPRLTIIMRHSNHRRRNVRRRDSLPLDPSRERREQTDPLYRNSRSTTSLLWSYGA